MDNAKLFCGRIRNDGKNILHKVSINVSFTPLIRIVLATNKENLKVNSQVDMNLP